MNSKRSRSVKRLVIVLSLLIPSLAPMLPLQTAVAYAAAPAQTTEWRGEYYDNVNLNGTPLVRHDTKIDFDWGSGSPMKGIHADNFSVRWTRQLDFEARTYRFNVRVDDGARLWVDGQLLIDQWNDGAARTYTVEKAMTKGQHQLRLEMYERTGQASITFSRKALDAPSGWRGEYFANRKLKGSPALVRNDANINFNWGTGAPAAGLPVDNFSVRWTRRVHFGAATYRFSVDVDDGVRLWVDGQLLIDRWHDAVAHYSRDLYLAEGAHDIRLEMYEHTGGAKIHLRWGQPTNRAEWKGKYYSNRNMQGTPLLVRTDSAIDFDWGAGSPAANLPADNFSVKWTAHVNFTPGTYRFCVKADDGVRVEMDDKAPFIRAWRDGLSTHCADVYVTGGAHKVRVEYYEHLGNATIQFWWTKVSDS